MLRGTRLRTARPRARSSVGLGRPLTVPPQWGRYGADVPPDPNPAGPSGSDPGMLARFGKVVLGGGGYSALLRPRTQVEPKRAHPGHPQGRAAWQLSEPWFARLQQRATTDQAAGDSNPSQRATALQRRKNGPAPVAKPARVPTDGPVRAHGRDRCG